jgi:hypothetical protein
MSIEWFRFDWHGHRRGTIQITVFYNPETNHTSYDFISTSHLEYLKSISKEYVPSAYQHLSSIGNSYTLRQTICEIFKNNHVVRDAYERYCRYLQDDEDTLPKNHLVDFAFSEFEWNGVQNYLKTIMDMTFQEKIKYDKSL